MSMQTKTVTEGAVATGCITGMNCDVPVEYVPLFERIFEIGGVLLTGNDVTSILSATVAIGFVINLIIGWKKK